MSETKLLEPSIADVLVAIETATDLSESQKRYWSCSLRQVCIYLDRPPESVKARWGAIGALIYALHHARVGANVKTLANHKSNARRALLWFGGIKNLPQRGLVKTPAWEALWGKIPEERQRDWVSGLIRYCSATAIEPKDVNEEVLDGYMRYRAETTRLSADDAARRRVARAWNACSEKVEGWPPLRLMEPVRKSLARLAWETFHPSLREEIERYLDGFTKVRRSARGKRIRPSKTSSINTRRRELQAFARKAVALGFAQGSFDSLAVLLKPEIVEAVIDAYWEEDGAEPRIYTIDMGWKLLSVAREIECLGKEDLDKLDDLRVALEGHRVGGLTEKNLTLIRQVLSPGVWEEVARLPYAMMAEARHIREHAPTKAAVTAQIAVGIGMLTFAPVRLGNLIHTRLDENLIKPAGPNGNYWLKYPYYDVKNRVQIDFEFRPLLTELIDEYVHDYRPILTRGFNEPWLFPGVAGGAKTGRTFSLQLTDRIRKATGQRITAHQFRHAAAALLLKRKPGAYELVRQLLGHKSAQTTMNFYVGLANIQATQIFGDIVMERVANMQEAAE